MNKKIKDIVVQVPHQQIAYHLSKLSKTTQALSRDIGTRTTRSNASLAYANLANRTAAELNRLAGFYPKSIEGVAWCARNLFEINLIVRHINRSDESMSRWLGQLAGDEKQIIQGFLALSDQPDRPEKRVLQDRLVAIDAISAKHGFAASGPFNIRAIADQENLSDEYIGLYKLFSKYVHPSSWLINSPKDSVQSEEYMNIFIIYSQIHAGDSHTRIKEWLMDHVRPQG